MLYPIDLEKLTPWWEATSVMLDWAAEHGYPWRPLAASFPMETRTLWSKVHMGAFDLPPFEQKDIPFFWVDRIAQFLLCAHSKEEDIGGISLEVLRKSPILTLSSVLASPKRDSRRKRGRVKLIPTLMPPPSPNQFHERGHPQYVRMLPESDLDGLRPSFREPIARFRESVDFPRDEIHAAMENNGVRCELTVSFPEESALDRLRAAEVAIQDVHTPASFIHAIREYSHTNEPAREGRILHRRRYRFADRFAGGTGSGWTNYLRRVGRVLFLAAAWPHELRGEHIPFDLLPSKEY